ncbi:NPL4-like protein 1 [Trifolium pratense]|uniref:NPL4-like protein 1 n=1 Tax=Trifolium pratense TaxID=57577 RepID=UPI001E691238|nr:NPL4-like protein 1 [Trifolium pratense]
MMLRIRSRDGLERVKIDNPNTTTVSELKSIIEKQLRIPTHNQTLSINQNLLLAKSQQDLLRFTDMSNPNTPLTALNLSHGSILFLAYEGERNVPGPTAFSPAGSFGRKMTMDDLIAKQMRVSRQENPHCELVSFDRDCANAFQHYVNETLAFAVKRGGFMYGTVSEVGKVEVDFIYEPPQQGSEENLVFFRDPEEEKYVEAIAVGLGMRRVGFIFTQTVSQDKKDYTLSYREVLQAAEYHAESGLKEWVTAVVKLEVSEEMGGADVHFEAFQMSDVCIRLFKEGWFDTEIKEDHDPKLSIMKKDVVVGVKDTKEVDNDFFLVVVKISDHQGPLSSAFPVENRNTQVTAQALKNHLERTKNLPFVKRISDFHLLLVLSRVLDVSADVPALTECVQTQSAVPEGYQILIESMASAA